MAFTHSAHMSLSCKIALQVEYVTYQTTISCDFIYFEGWGGFPVVGGGVGKSVAMWGKVKYNSYCCKVNQRKRSEMYLKGEYRHKLDAKGRLNLPASFRKALAKNLVVTLSPKKDYLMIFDDEGFESWIEALFNGAREDGGEGFKPNNLSLAACRKVLHARARNVELDNSGRLGVPVDLREAVSLNKEVVLVGDGDHFEIWDAKRWDEFTDSVDLTKLFVD